MKRNFKGFTLIELIITIVIIIVLSSISVPMYKGHSKKAKTAEGYVLLAAIRDAQKVYYQRYKRFLSQDHSSAGAKYTCNEEVLGIDARGNKYFTWFWVGYYASDHHFAAIACGTTGLPNLCLRYNLSLGQKVINYSDYDNSWN